MTCWDAKRVAKDSTYLPLAGVNFTQVILIVKQRLLTVGPFPIARVSRPRLLNFAAERLMEQGSKRWGDRRIGCRIGGLRQGQKREVAGRWPWAAAFSFGARTHPPSKETKRRLREAPPRLS